MQDIQPTYSSIAELAARQGTDVPCAGNLPVKLDDANSIWLIERGTVNLFLVELKDGVEQSAPQHLLRREAGWFLPGVPAHEPDAQDGTTLSLVAKGLPGTLLKRLPVSLLSKVHPGELAEQTDAWLSEMTDTLSRFATPVPRPTALAESGAIRVPAHSTLSVQRKVMWASPQPGSALLFMDIVDPMELAETSDSGNALLPLTRTSWLTTLEETTLECVSTQTLAEQGHLQGALSYFHEVAFTLERLNRRLAVVDDVNLERARTTSRRTAEKAARARLFNLYDQPVGRYVGLEDTALVDALSVIGRHEGIDFKIPARSGPSQAPLGLVDVLDASGVRARRVWLKDEDGWWRTDSHAMLGFRAKDGQPVALLPGVFGGYREIDPVSKRTVRVSQERADALREDAWMFYRPLPAGEVKPADLLGLALQGSGADIARLVLAGLPYGLIQLLPALALGFVAHEVAAGGTAGAIYAVAWVLAGFGLLGALLHLAQSTAMMRLEGRSASRAEAAFWDRLMRLPPAILHRHPSGDLAMSGMTFQNLRDGLQGVVAESFLSVIFLIPVFVVIFFYDAALGGLALAFSLGSLLITWVLGVLQIAPYGRMIRASRRVAGRLFQIVGGFAKLRVENAEGSAFAMWAEDYREQKRAELDLSVLEGHSRAFSAALPFLAGAFLLLAAVTVGERIMPVGDFLVVYLVFIAFQSAIARLGESLGTVAALLPAFKQMRPLLAADPETETEGEPVEYLGGDLLFDRISFRYDPDGPLILDDVTIHARAGKIGAVPQAVGLHPLDIWDNLVSHHDGITTDEVWEAARTAEIEKEIKGMPMGMMTMVGASGSVLSGGESQRVTIARSVMGKPRIMLFDEATNWLDNENQARVMDNLTDLTSTRLVIAHRLSTLEQADRIYVLSGGKVVQHGSFDELMDEDGVFRELVKRQIA